MQLSIHSSREIQDSAASLSERAHLLCGLAKEQEEAGNFEAARATMGELWERVGDRPKLDGLDEKSRAEVLLRAGTLSGWIGSARQIPGAQELAKDLITESATIFEQLGQIERVAEARIDLAICYWREGALDEARVSIEDALMRLGEVEGEQSLRALLNKSIVEQVSNRQRDALRVLRDAAPLSAASANHGLKAKFHNEYATVLKNVGLAENREEYIDQALVEYAAAGFHFEQAGHKRFQARVENNEGFLFGSIRRFTEAHEHLDRARSLFADLKDKGSVAQVDDTRARVLLDQGLYDRAATTARAAVRTLEEGDELSLLAEALITNGVALARMGSFSQARTTLQRAIDTAQRAGDANGGGVAALSVVEELTGHLTIAESLDYYRRAESLLVQSQHPGIKNRLAQCARRLLAAVDFSGRGSSATLRANADGDGTAAVGRQNPTAEVPWAGSSLEEEVLHFEGDLIKRALEASGGSVTRAARMLGTTHQGLAFILNGRHSSLLSVRTPVKPRRRSIIRYQ